MLVFVSASCWRAALYGEKCSSVFVKKKLGTSKVCWINCSISAKWVSIYVIIQKQSRSLFLLDKKGSGLMSATKGCGSLKRKWRWMFFSDWLKKKKKHSEWFTRAEVDTHCGLQSLQETPPQRGRRSRSGTSRVCGYAASRLVCRTTVEMEKRKRVKAEPRLRWWKVLRRVQGRVETNCRRTEKEQQTSWQVGGWRYFSLEERRRGLVGGGKRECRRAFKIRQGDSRGLMVS